MDASQAIVSLNAVSFAYPGGEDPVFQDLDFALGLERIGLVGDNGSGKTTLMHLIMGLLAPDSGEMRFKERVPAGEEGLFELRRKVGFLFQNTDDQLFMPTVLEDVAFGPLNHGLTRDQARDKALATLSRLGLDGFEHRITHRLSGGEKKLVALAGILAMEPEAMLLDEPTNDLDPDTRERLVEILLELDQSMLVVSHDWDFLDRTVDRIAVLEAGRITYQDRSILHVHRHAHPAGHLEHAHVDHPHVEHGHDGPHSRKPASDPER